MGNGIREPSVAELQRLARLFNMNVGHLLDMNTDIKLEDKSGLEQTTR